MNCFLAITCILALATSINADGLGLGALGGHGLVYAPGHASVDYYAYPRYAFEYAVKDPHTGDNKAQWEKRDGDVVKGAYSLVEPDGSLRVVEYWADDKSGFNAVVKRLGPNLHPVAAPVAPIYKAPIPALASHGPIAPISVGPIANYHGLASAPLISGPLLGGGGAVSSASVYRAPGVPVVRAPIAAPIAPAPILPAPAPILAAPIAPAPILAAPVYKAPIVSAPLPAPVVAGPIGLGGLGHLGGLGLGGAGLGLGHLGGGGHLGGAGHLGGVGYLGGAGHVGSVGNLGLGYGAGLIRAPLAGHGGYLEELGHGLLNRGGLGHGYLGGYKH